MNKRWLVAGLLALTGLRLLRVGALELSPDESYYLLWSQRLDLAYYSKGPGIALVMRAATELFGSSETAVRALAPLLALAITLLVFALARRLFGERAAIAAAVALQFVPIFNAGSLLMTVDPLSLTSWMATLVLGWSAMQAADEPRRWRLWLFAGGACGLGVLCKYTNLLVLCGLALAAAFSSRRARNLAGAAAGAAVASLAMVPPLLWNAAHGWPTATHMVERGDLDGSAGLRPRETLEFVVVHFGTYSPLIFLAILMALPGAIRRARTDEATRFLLLASAPILLMYSALALHEAGEANWTGPGVLTLLILAAADWAGRIRDSGRARAFVAAALALGMLLSVALMDTDLLRAAGAPLRWKSDPTARLRGWRATANAVARLRRDLERAEGRPLLLVANHYGVASELAYYLPRAPVAAPGLPAVHVVPTARPRNQYWFWPGFADAGAGLDGAAALYVSDRTAPPSEEMTRLFAGGCAPLEALPIESEGDTIRTMRPWLCRDLESTR